MDADKESGCIFCFAAEAGDGLTMYRTANVVVMLNKFPYTTGHLMVAPAKHVADLNGLETEEAHALIEMVRRCERILKEEYKPQGMNIGINEGHCGGAGIPGHIHVHLVPRWMGDTNFMPVIGEVRVLPEALERTRERLAPYFEG